MESFMKRLYNRTLSKTNSQESQDGSGNDDSAERSSSLYLDMTGQNEQENVAPSLSQKLAFEMHVKRKEERSKLVNSNRNLAAPEQYDKLFKCPIVEEPHGPVAENYDRPNQMTASKAEERAAASKCVDSTYVVGNNSSESKLSRGRALTATKSTLSRNKALEQWRKNRQQTLQRTKSDNRPVFKVYHVDPKDFDFVVRNKDPVMAPPPQPKPTIHQLSQIRPLEASHLQMMSKGVAGFKTSSPKVGAAPVSRVSKEQPPFYFGNKNQNGAQSQFKFAASLGNGAKPAASVSGTAQAKAKPAEEFAKPKPPVPTSSRYVTRSASAPKPPTTKPATKPEYSKISRTDSSKNSSSSSRSSNYSQTNSTKNESVNSTRSTRSIKQAEPPSKVDHLDELTTRLSSIVTLEQLPEEAHREAEEVKRMSNETQILTDAKVEEIEVAVAEPEDPRASDLAFDFESVPLESRDVKYYRSLVKNRTRLLNDYSDNWLGVCEKRSEGEFGPPDDVQGDIRSACGLAQLLIDERFDQFSDLIDQCEASSQRPPDSVPVDEDVKPVLCSDLQGFWDMVEFQVKDVEKKFAYLKLLKEHDYIADNIPPHLLNPAQASKAPAKRKFIKPYVSKPKAPVTADAAEPSEAAQKSPAKNKAAGARSQLAKIKAARLLEMKKSSSTESDPLAVDFVMQKRKSVSTDDLTLSARRKSTRKSMRLTTPQLTALPDLPEGEPVDASARRYNLRSRPSQVTKFDSPLPSAILKSSRKSTAVGKRVSLFPEPEVFEFTNTELSHAAEQTTVLHVADEHSNTLKAAPADATMSPGMAGALGAGGQQSRFSMSSTPVKSFLARTRQSLGHTLNPIDVTKSPLLKLAFISSHGKRMSLSANPNNTSRQF